MTDTPATPDDGEAAIARERAACAADEGFDIERTELANGDLRAKLAYWRQHGAPAYHGPKAAS